MNRIVLFSLLCGLCNPLQAEVVSDGTLTPAIQRGSGDFEIPAAWGRQAGENLFHGFQRFNLADNEVATFTGPDSVRHIISRITGGEASLIDGGIVSTLPAADLFFLNPAGILFGPNARLNIGGSLYVSSADYLRFHDHHRFEVNTSPIDGFSSVPPAAFGFLTSRPGKIAKQGGFLLLRSANTLAFIGGDIRIAEQPQSPKPGTAPMSTFMAASAGQIHLISVDADGEIALNPDSVAEKPAIAGGTIHITDSTPPTQDSARGVGNLDVSGAGGGRISIQSGQFILENAYLFADTWGAQNGQGIRIQADDVRLSAGARITTQVLQQEAAGRGGDITVETESLSIHAAKLTTSTDGSGDAGTLRIAAAEQVEITGRYFDKSSGLSSATNHTGQAGDIVVHTPRLIVADGAEIRADTQGAGAAGDVNITVNHFRLENGGQISVSAGSHGDSDGSAHAGRLKITATDSFQISGAFDADTPSAVLSNTFTDGNGGDIVIDTPLAVMQNQAKIQAASQNQGNAGDIVLKSERFYLRNAAVETRAIAAGGGNIHITAEDFAYGLDSDITASAGGAERADHSGNITLQAVRLCVLHRSALDASAFGGDGGNIHITAGQFVRSGDSTLNVTSELGVDGQIGIEAAEADFSAMALPPPPFLNPGGIRRCASRSVETISEFVQTPVFAAPADDLSVMPWLKATEPHTSERKP